MLIQLILSLIISPLTYSDSSNWAVIIAGSNTWVNYRHQADVSHMYQILKNKGAYDPNKIITMMYNDIAYNEENPYPGEIYNSPYSSNVYKNIKIDYQGNNVTAVNFLNVLKGNKTIPNFKVLESNSEDNIFIYYSNHGATGLVGMPYGPPLYADDLIDTLNYMYQYNMYNQLIFYLEACESGSIFDGILDPSIKIYAVTASTPTESSYAFYYNDTLNTYMADEFSIRFMQDTSVLWLFDNTLLMQYKEAKKIMTLSTPQQYGDLNFTNENIKDFQAYEYKNENKNNNKNLKLLYNNFIKNTYIQKNVIDNRDVKLSILQKKYKKWPTEKNKMLMQKEINDRNKVDIYFTKLVKYIFNDINMGYIMNYNFKGKINFDCLRDLYNLYNLLYKFSDYSLKYVRIFVYLCLKK